MEPLEVRKINVTENETTIQVPALSPKWVEKKKFLHFVPPSSVVSGGIDWKEWTEIIEFIKADLHWLLKLPHHKFWSQIVYDEKLHASLVSFLQEAPRFYSDERETLKTLPSSWSLFKETQNLVFLVFLRMSTPKESKEYFITPSTFGQLIYDKFIFDIPKLMDLCALFGPTGNSALLSKMFQSIFLHQPKYMYDLEDTGSSLIQVFHLILGQLGLEDNQAAGSSHSGPLSPEELEEIVIYILDIAATLWYFVDVYPASAPVFIIAGIPNQLTDFYERSIPCLSRQIELIPSAQKEKLNRNLNAARKFLLQIYNSLLHSVSIKPILVEGAGDVSPTDQENCVEQWLEWLTYLISERQRHFVVDYNAVFPIQDDIDLMTQLNMAIDSTRIEYVKGGLKGFTAEFGLSTMPASLRSADGGSDPSKMMALVLQVKELLPDLRDDFIQACLKHYDYNPESVINAVLEDNLPPHLADRPIPDPASVPNNPVPVYDEPAEISKKTRTKTVHFDEMKEVLNDKQSLKNVILERVNEQLADEYDDEYDDTYDGHAVGSEEPDAHEDLRRSFVVPRVLRPKEEDDYEEEEEEEDTTPERPRDQFVPNPAELREQAEARRMARRGFRPPGQPGPPRNVVGAPRGQGQEKDTIVARRHKTENKTRGANHNRRYMADRKRREF